MNPPLESFLFLSMFQCLLSLLNNSIFSNMSLLEFALSLFVFVVVFFFYGNLNCFLLLMKWYSFNFLLICVCLIITYVSSSINRTPNHSSQPNSLFLSFPLFIRFYFKFWLSSFLRINNQWFFKKTKKLSNYYPPFLAFASYSNGG